MIRKNLLELFVAAVAAAAVLLASCTPPRETQTPPGGEQQPPPAVKRPDTTVQKRLAVNVRIGTLDLSNGTGFRIEQRHVDSLAAFVKQESLDILTLQGVTRYPGLATRIDIIDALMAATSMSASFGESIEASDRIIGHAVFSLYPILSRATTPYAGLKAVQFASAHQAVVDLGQRQVVTVSTLIPNGASQDDVQKCLKVLDDFRTSYENNVILITGNLPRDVSLQNRYPAFRKLGSTGRGSGPPIWVAAEDSIKLIQEKSARSPWGLMTIAELGL